MKILKNLILVVFVYSVGEGFNFQGFLAQCASNGIALMSTLKSDVNGSAQLAGDKLSVNLYEVAVATETDSRGRAISARLVPLPGNLNDYESAIQAIVDENNP